VQTFPAEPTLVAAHEIAKQNAHRGGAQLLLICIKKDRRLISLQTPMTLRSRAQKKSVVAFLPLYLLAFRLLDTMKLPDSISSHKDNWDEVMLDATN